VVALGEEKKREATRERRESERGVPAERREKERGRRVR
jgi:hypothetical protein